MGLDKQNKTADTRLLYVTTGILLVGPITLPTLLTLLTPPPQKMLVGKKHLNDWTHVILDEVH